MIRVTRLNGEQFALNPDLIERVEGHPDTVAFLVDGTKYVVKESVDEVLDEIREYRARILATSYEMDRGEYRSAVSDGDARRATPGPRSSRSRAERSADPWIRPLSSASSSRSAPSWSR